MGQKPKKLTGYEETGRIYDDEGLLHVRSHREFISACADDGVSYGEQARRFLSDDSDGSENAFSFAQGGELNFD